MKSVLKYKFIIFSVLVSFLSIHSLFHSGLPPTHDGEYHVIRFYEFDKTLRSGSLYPRWAQDLNSGYGVPLFNYVYPLPNYVASSFHFLGFSFIDSFKLNMIVASIFGSTFFYLWSKKYWGEMGGLVSSVFYSFTPYRLLDIYVRGSVGEVWALSFFPAFLWAIDAYLDEQNLRYFVFSSVFLGLIIFSHNILGLALFSFSIFYLFIRILMKGNRGKLFLNITKILVVGVGISAIFWLPALLEKQFVKGLEIYDYSKNFPDLSQLLIPSWGSGFSVGGLNNQMSLQIGIANILAVALSVALLVFFRRKKDKNRLIILFFLIAFFVISLMMLKISLPVWRNVPLMSYFQFPWRLLSLVLIITSFLAGSLVYALNIVGKTILAKAIAVVLITSSILFSINYIKPAYYHQRDDKYYTSRSNFIDSTNSSENSFNTVWFNPQLRKVKKRLESRNAEINVLINKPTREKAIIKRKIEGKALVNIAYFPGWKVHVNKKIVPVNITRDGVFEINLPRGESLVDVELKDTPVRLMSYLVTLASISLLFGLFVKEKYIKIKE